MTLEFSNSAIASPTWMTAASLRLKSARPSRRPEQAPSLRTEDLDLTEEIDERDIDELSVQLLKGVESSGSRGRKAGRLRGPEG